MLPIDLLPLCIGKDKIDFRMLGRAFVQQTGPLAMHYRL
jgi:hypothetical protein